MSSIQQGIQASHAQMEMFIKYQCSEGLLEEQLQEWATHHKTMICLNGGMNSDLFDIKTLMEHKDNTFPWSFFEESEAAMGGMLTNIAIVLPERIYETASKIRSREYILVNNSVYKGEPYPVFFIEKMTNFEIELINLLNSCGLAR